MFRHIRRLTAFVFFCGSLVVVSASPPVIGVARSVGAFRINHASVPGSATILDGASLETGAAPSNINLKTGQRLLLASSSVAEIHQDRLVLSKGTAELDVPAAYRIDTRNLQIGTTDPAARIRVDIEAEGRVRVAASGGQAEVRSGKGVLLAQVGPGSAVQVPGGGYAPSAFTGIVRQEKGKYLLTDTTTQQTVELRGSQVAGLKGKRVRVAGPIVAGEIPAAGASLIISVAEATVVKAGAGTAAAGAGASSGLSTGTIAVIGGAAAVGGTVGGLYAADVIGGDSSSVSR